ncbi:MAG: rhomboid family intramembrane serine protease [Defluviitaleaceae bacterium]|nr:rhomboid family intramembrane serine protease [Defluviitaleaceae bacterium]
MNPFKRIQYNAPVILSFALLSLLALGLAELTNGQSNRLIFSVYRAPFSDPLMYIRLFTHAIGHANLAHFFNNFMIILIIGPMLEERYGAKWLVIMMVVTAFVTGVLHVIISDAAKLGASGIVFMLILLGSFTNLQRGRVPLTLILALVIYIGREIVASAGADTTNIAYMTHIVGGLCGAMFGFIANKDALK